LRIFCRNTHLYKPFGAINQGVNMKLTREEKIEIAVDAFKKGDQPFGITVADVVNEITEANDAFALDIMRGASWIISLEAYKLIFNTELIQQLNEAVDYDELETRINAQ
jgi:hypothetical protein